MRITIDIRRDASASVVLNNLFKQTQMQANFGMNMVAIVDGAPHFLTLKQMLQYYLDPPRRCCNSQNKIRVS